MSMLLHVEDAATGVSGEDATVVVLDGEFASLDPAGMISTGELLTDYALRNDPPRLIVDLAGTRYVGSLFIRLLIQLGSAVRKRGGSMVLCGARGFCAEVLSTANLHHVWPFCESRDEAIAMLRQTSAV